MCHIYVILEAFYVRFKICPERLCRTNCYNVGLKDNMCLCTVKLGLQGERLISYDIPHITFVLTFQTPLNYHSSSSVHLF